MAPATSAGEERLVLPDHVKPIHYDLSLYDIEFGGDFTYQGTVLIDVAINASTDQVTLNSHQIKIKDASFTPESAANAIQQTDVSYDTHLRTTTIKLSDKIPASGKGQIKIVFEGVVNDAMAGFYRSRYKPEGPVAAAVPQKDDDTFMYSTQFEACDARRAFPCFDEPNLKATFDISIEVPKELTVLGNMDVKKTCDSKDGRHVVTFNRTPIMSTYLIAWAIGDFEYTETLTQRLYGGKRLPVRIYCTRGLKHQTKWALQETPKALDFFSETFGIDYPLPKVDLLAVHEFTHGAMENWGLITYRTSALLFDENKSRQGDKLRISYIISHELAHQWFGNLVTMDWWNGLWLNEGFATWMGWYTIDVLHPEWKAWSRFVSSSPATAMALDSLRNSHPIEVPLRSALDVDQIFDSISYQKGSSVIHMLSSLIGVSTFLKGVAKYLSRLQYKNAVSSDLWAALSEVSGLDVKDFMDPWIKRIGFPCISVTEGDGEITLRQERFLRSGDLKPEEDETVWWIPLGLRSNLKEKPGTETLSTKEATFKVGTGANDFYKLNTDCTGLFYTNYPSERLAKLGAVSSQLSVEDRFGLIAEANNLTKSGHGSPSGFFELIKNFKNDSEFLVVSRLIESLTGISGPFLSSEDADIYTGVSKFTLDVVSPFLKKHGWTLSNENDFIATQFRSLVIQTTAINGHTEVIDEARRRFKAHVAGEESIDPNLRAPIFNAVVRWGGKEEYEQMKKIFLESHEDFDMKVTALSSMGMVQDKELLGEYVKFAFSRDVPVQDLHICFHYASGFAPFGQDLVWKFIQENWESLIYPRLSSNLIVIDRFIRVSLSGCKPATVADEIDAFFKGRDDGNKGYDRALAIVTDNIRTRGKYLERSRADIRNWLTENKYI